MSAILSRPTGEVSVQEGDLVRLKSPPGYEILDKDSYLATNTRTGQTGQVTANCLYLLPVIERPTAEILKIFRTPKRRGSFRNYLSEDNLQKLPNLAMECSESLQTVSRPVLDNAPTTMSTPGSESRDDKKRNELNNGQSKICHTPEITYSSVGDHQLTVFNSIDCVSAL
ncbi:hypothetical protein LSH36_816g00011 [Paralvinella palmiformis]|uniref:SH3 domain-containing protein n=1 Tax=Paralvinella palmiformis TaxID=53620 RepID=A0AAD9J0F9_9ANNE|nr:hypothetical protein LSH36_816g00011 [Paralvinella palmiformis]